MIILFEKNEKSFDTLGLGVLKDATSCVVTEGLNGEFELEMEYPITGSHYSDISLQRLILVPPNMHDQPQPFRIYSITKPINGKVIINAEHISYDMSGYIVKQFIGNDSYDTLTKIQEESFPDSPFKLSTDKFVQTSMETDKPYSQRALLAGQTDSVLDIYGGEYKFDRFDVYLLKNRGRDRGITIRHGKNLTDLEEETDSTRLFSGIFPFYSATLNETTSITEKYFQGVYIVEGNTPFAGNWLSLSDGGNPLIPIIEKTPVQIKTEGEYYDKVCYFQKAKQEENLFNCYIRKSTILFSEDWLSLTDGGSALSPVEKTIYKIFTEGDFIYKTYIWNGSQYVEFTGTGFYYIYSDEERPDPPLTRISSGTQERYVYIDLMEDEELTNGIIFVEGQESIEPKKILSLDLTGEFEEEPSIEQVKAKAIDYLKNNDLQKINNNLTVSFIKLSDTEEYKKFQDLEIIELGDYVNVFYDELGVNSKLQVIRTEFNVLSNNYNEIELGTKSASLSESVITTGDGVSALRNDANYTDQISVVNLFAQNLTAEYITGKDAYLSTAQINQLKTERIEVKGMIEASEGSIDSLVAQLLVADNAEIKNKLRAGEIEVAGKITATAGDIGGCIIKDGKLLVSTAISIGKNSDGTYNFSVDKDGNTTANSLRITGGEIQLGDKDFSGGRPFSVDKKGNVVAKSFNFSESGTSIVNGQISTSSLFFNEGVRIEAKGSSNFKWHTAYFNLELLDSQYIHSSIVASRVKRTVSFTNQNGQVINSATLISMPDSNNWGHGGAFILKNDMLYVGGNANSSLISIIDTTTPFITSSAGSITMPKASTWGTGGAFIEINNKIYVGVGTPESIIAVIDTSTNIASSLSMQGVLNSWGSNGSFILVGNKLYVGGGRDTSIIVVIDTTNNSRKSITMPSSKSWGSGGAFALVGSKLYVGHGGDHGGGHASSSNAEIAVIDTKTDVATKITMPLAKRWGSGGAFSVAGTKLYVCGILDDMSADSTMAVINTLNDTVKTITMPFSNFWGINGSLILSGNKLYVGYTGGGGIGNNYDNTSLCFIDINTDSISSLTMPDKTGWGSGGAFILIGNKLYVGGGSAFTKMACIDTITNVVTPLEMPSPGNWGYNGAFVLAGNKLYIGGRDSENNEIEVIDINTNVPTPITMPYSGYWGSGGAFALVGDKLYIGNGGETITTRNSELAVIDTSTVTTTDAVLFNSREWRFRLKGMFGDTLIQNSGDDNDVWLMLMPADYNFPVREWTILTQGYNYETRYLATDITSDLAMITESRGDNGKFISDSSFVPKYDAYCDLGEPYYKWRAIYSNSGVINTSDKNEKEEINYDISNYNELFNKLKPTSFKFIKGSSGRTHLGFISQDVEKALLECDMTSKDFAGYTKTLKEESIGKSEEELTDDDYIYGLRYSELHALEIYKIQKLQKELEEIKQIINKEKS